MAARKPQETARKCPGKDKPFKDMPTGTYFLQPGPTPKISFKLNSSVDSPPIHEVSILMIQSRLNNELHQLGAKPETHEPPEGHFTNKP
jgi:hypothetical protein